MKKIAIAAALLMISASAHAGTYSYEGVTVHVQDGCRSSSCVSVYAPGYGYYHGETLRRRLHKVHKDTSRIASAKKDDAAAAPATRRDAGQDTGSHCYASPASSDAAPAK